MTKEKIKTFLTFILSLLKGEGSGEGFKRVMFFLSFFTNTLLFAESNDLILARQLSVEGDHYAAAIEFRRLALAADRAEVQAAYYWSAAYEYLQGGKNELSEKMLDHAQDLSPSISLQANLLRGEAAYRARRHEEAAFYFESVATEADDRLKTYAQRRQASALLQDKKTQEAKTALPTVSQVVEKYEAGSDKNPRVGGILGMIPGMGYAYAGEWANAVRSVILNGIFIWGMVETSDEELWGGFAVITFFEITWYSGSIYGGIDASLRYNRNRLDETVDGVMGSARFEPDYEIMPTLQLKFEL